MGKSKKEKNRTVKIDSKTYDKELYRLQVELVKMQEWVRQTGEKVAVIFEGRDAAGKGGVIKRIIQKLNPRVVRVAALAKPTEKEMTQWYFQRYVQHLPAGGEIVLYDRSWYNRAGVEKVMGYCSDDEYQEFLRSCPEFEHMLIRSGIRLIKYWFSVSDDEQIRRIHDRNDDPTKRWKISPIDLTTFTKWVDVSKAKDLMFEYTDTEESPWYAVDADNKKCARLNCITHLLSLIPYKDLTPKPIKMPDKILDDRKYVRPPIDKQKWVPEVYKTDDLKPGK